jgi:hypothetical protein
MDIIANNSWERWTHLSPFFNRSHICSCGLALVVNSMNAKRILNALLLIALILALRNPGSAQGIDNPDSKLSESQKSLMEGSKKAILKTGMSEPYFNRHFRVVEVLDKPGDRRVVWRFSINEYEATVNDSIGYYTEGGKRISIHSVGNVLSSTTDIKRTIPRSRALRIMRGCVGNFAGTAAEYRAGASGRAWLFLTAASVPKPRRLSPREVRERERKRSERESRQGAVKADREGDTDVVDEEEENDRPPILIGSVNLETGKCTKGIARAGPPKVR